MLSKGQVCLSALRTPVDNLLFQNTNSLEPTWPTSAFKYGQSEHGGERRDKELDLINAIALCVGRRGSTSPESGVEKEPAALWNEEWFWKQTDHKTETLADFIRAISAEDYTWWEVACSLQTLLNVTKLCLKLSQSPRTSHSLPCDAPETAFLPPPAKFPPPSAAGAQLNQADSTRAMSDENHMAFSHLHSISLRFYRHACFHKLTSFLLFTHKSINKTHKKKKTS